MATTALRWPRLLRVATCLQITASKRRLKAQLRATGGQLLSQEQQTGPVVKGAVANPKSITNMLFILLSWLIGQLQASVTQCSRLGVGNKTVARDCSCLAITC
jgi:hypothetical protein